MAVRLPTSVPTALLLIALLPVGAVCQEERLIEVRSLAFKGVRSIDESRLRDVLATRQSARLPWGAKRHFNRAHFDADLKRIEAFYTDRGYPDARVASFDVKLNSKQDKVDLTITVSEGEPIRVGAVTFQGFDEIPERHLAYLRRRAPIKTGEPLDRQLVVTTREEAANELKDHGYPYAKVEIEERDAGPRRKDLVFMAEPGGLASFGAIEVSGNTSVDDQVIRRELNYRPGDLFRRSLMQDSQRKLYQLELFEFVNIEAVGPDDRRAEVATRVTVTEGKHRRLEFGAGYGTEEKVRAEVQWHHVNFFGGARTAGVHAKWSSLDRGVKLDFTEPFFFTPHLSLGAEAQQWYADEPAYRLASSGGRVTVRHQANPRTTLAIAAINEFDSSRISNEALSDLSLRNQLIALGLDPRTGRQDGTLSAVAVDVSRNTTANLLNATSGYLASLHVEQAGVWLPGTFRYYTLSGEGRHYARLGRRAVVANRVLLGSIASLGRGSGNIPFSKRFFLGGSSSLRGWGRFEVSPLSGSGLPIGGYTMLQATSEIRTPLAGKLGAVLFVDAGNVWPKSWGMRLGDLRYDIGPGLRYLTPIGPVRFDFGYQLTPIAGLLVNGKPETRRWRVHFSIGQAF